MGPIRMKHYPQCLGFVIALTAWTGLVGANDDNAPATVRSDLLRGAIDFHVHSGPDSFTRSVLDHEIASVARRKGMGALVFKNHFTMTADRAWLSERITGMPCYGGVVLNRAVGGLNAEAIERMTTFSGNRGRVVWLPTFDAENHVKRFGDERPFVSVVRDGEVVPELREVLRVIAKHNLVLCTGHSSADECLTIIRAAHQLDISRIVITHAMADPVRMTIDHLRETARLGAKIECVWLSNLQGPNSHLKSQRNWRHVSTDDYVKAIRAVGHQHFVLASDLGQYLNPLHTDGLQEFLMQLKARGISDEQLRQMSRENAAKLLGIGRDSKVSP